MNKFEHLQKEAGITLMQRRSDGFYVISPESLEAYSRLVVKECIKQIKQVPNGYSDYRNQIEDGMRDACVEAVNEHFGVGDV